MSGRRVDFPSEEGLTWGIELTIPLNYPILRNALKNVSGINIPDHIDTITYLDVAPQESLPKNIRNIRTKKYSFLPSQLEVLARKTISSSKNEKLQETFNVPRPSDMQRSAQVERMITEVFGNNQKGKDDFNEYVSKNKANELVIVHGHGGSELIIGEQYNDGTTAEDGTPIQKKGNRIKIDKVLERYNNPKKHAAILLHNCHSSDEKVIAKKVPVFMPIGHVGGVASMLRINKTQSSVPVK
ncbi:MAG: hypothetical protein AAB437_04315 [Patescibacteria group bacterium]